jgi:integrase/recombinase XerC
MNNLLLDTSDYRVHIDRVIDMLDVRDNTRYEYKQRIKPFIQYVAVEGFQINVLLSYKRSLDNKEYSVSTKNKYLTCARLFLRECYRLGLVDKDVTTNIKSFRQDKKHKISGLTDGDVSLICEWMRMHPNSLRENALLCLLLFQGLRQAEICNLKIQDIDFEAKTLFVLGKGRDDKELVHLHPKTTNALRRYCSSTDLNTDYLFVSSKMPSSSIKLTERGLRHIIKTILSELGIDKTVHGFRHYYTTKLIREMPSNLTVIAQFTRHKSLETLQIYNDSVLMEADLVNYWNVFDNLLV